MPYFSDRIGDRKRLSTPPNAWTEIASIGSSILKRSTMFLVAMYPVPKNEKTKYSDLPNNPAANLIIFGGKNTHTTLLGPARLFMAIPVVDFLRQGYKIRKVFG